MSLTKLQSEEDKKRGVYYEVDTSRSMGKGGMGQVYHGFRVENTLKSRKEVAVKFLFNDLPERVIERARREAMVQVKHEHLLLMYPFIETDDVINGHVVKHYHVASEFVDGVRLFDLIHGKVQNQAGQIAPHLQYLYDLYRNDRFSFAKNIILQILYGVQALHENEYIHRDLDPSNIMVDVNGRIKIIDYGIAKKLKDINTFDQDFTNTGEFIGKPAYASPELVLGDIKSQNFTTDVYAIGIILFQLVTGRFPFEGNTPQIIRQQVHDKMPLHLIPYHSLRKIVKKATEKNQNKRYQSVSEFIESVKKAKNNPHTEPLSILKWVAIAAFFTILGFVFSLFI